MASAQVLRQECGVVVLQLCGAQGAERRDSRTVVRAEVTQILGRQPTSTHRAHGCDSTQGKRTRGLRGGTLQSFAWFVTRSLWLMSEKQT